MIVPIIDWGLRKLSYLTYNIIVYHKLDINESSVVSLGYWILCVIYVLILYGILFVIRNIGIIPLVTNLDIKIFYNIVNFIINIFMKSTNKIIEILQTW